MKTTKSSYSEKLKDPRWQKKRLEVMSANDFCCEICGDSEETLHVHHKEYFKSREIWEYDNKQLAVICKNCHNEIHSNNDLLKMVCSYANLDGPRNRDELAFIIAAHLGIELETVISWSEHNQTPWVVAMYETGLKIQEIEDEWLKEFWADYRVSQTA